MKYFKIKCRKTFLFVICFFMVVFTIGVVSCTNDVNEDSIADENDSSIVFIESSISVNQMDSLSNVIKNVINSSTRSLGCELTENEAKQILKPLINDGKNIQRQLLDKKTIVGFNTHELNFVKDMTDVQLAELSFTFNYVYKNSMNESQILECLKYAIGIQGLSDLVKGEIELRGFKRYYNGTKMLMTAKTARQIICAFAKRTLGWVGIAWMMYDFSECMNKK
ncbi:hypothetical protein [Leyella stercorea]|uniref:hypothetical protein n=1 Tax=Leyella stercorea TaxID=363265 RepID=UPI0026DCA630|nr:hypothetical protein [Leyella stercorea]